MPASFTFVLRKGNGFPGSVPTEQDNQRPRLRSPGGHNSEPMRFGAGQKLPDWSLGSGTSGAVHTVTAAAKVAPLIRVQGKKGMSLSARDTPHAAPDTHASTHQAWGSPVGLSSAAITSMLDRNESSRRPSTSVSLNFAETHVRTDQPNKTTRAFARAGYRLDRLN